jgi:hypothetical protein
MYFLPHLWAFKAITDLRVLRVYGGIEVNIWPNQSARADGDETRIDDCAAAVDIDVIPKSHLAAIVTPERRLYPRISAQLRCFRFCIIKLRGERLGRRDYSVREKVKISSCDSFDDKKYEWRETDINALCDKFDLLSTTDVFSLRIETPTSMGTSFPLLDQFGKEGPVELPAKHLGLLSR